MAEPRGFRNNNPGNIEYGPFAKSAGAVGSDGRFAVFPEMDAGKAAMVNLLRSYAKRGFNTPNSMINRWAPPADGNPTSAYAADVAKATGIGADDPVDVNDEAGMQRMVNAMIVRENGRLPTGSAPIGTQTAGGVSANDTLAGGAGNDTLAGGDGVDRLKALLSSGYDTQALSDADKLIARGDEAAKGATNWLDVINSGAASIYGQYKKGEEGGKKKAYDENQRQGLANASDMMGVARLLMASPDQATQLKGVEMLKAAEKEANDKAAAAAKAGQKSYGKAPVIGTNAAGELIAIQFNDAGEAIETKLPAGAKLSEKLLSVDTATGTTMLGGTTHKTVGSFKKELEDAERQKEAGTQLAKAQEAWPSVDSRTNRVLNRLERLDKDPARASFTGYSGYLPTVTTEGNDYKGLLDEVAGNTFLAGFSDLRGAGAITETEGLKAQAALSRLQTIAPSDKGFQAALDDAREVFREIRTNAATRARMKSAGGDAAPGDAPDAGAGNFKVLGVR
jgi:hypothetical protein